MELREYMSVRRAYSLVRQEVEPEKRLTFAEFAILCRLDAAGGSLKTSDIADYQGSLRPTMTHRTKHLATLGLIERLKGDADRRNVVCRISEEGRAYIHDLCARTCGMIVSGHALSFITAERMRKYVDAMGPLSCLSSDLILLGLLTAQDGSCAVTDLVELLGLLQPTVSMSVSSLEREGLVERGPHARAPRASRVRLTPEGEGRARLLAEQISRLVVRRRPRTK